MHFLKTSIICVIIGPIIKDKDSAFFFEGVMLVVEKCS